MEFKFKAIHKEKRELLTEDYPGQVFQWLKEGQPIHIIQYIGEKDDANDREIYEGDVIRFATEDGFTLAYTIFDSGEEGNIFVSGFEAKVIRDITDEVCSEAGDLLNGWDGSLEVIGNIYLNPEFLTMPASVE